MLGLTSGVLGCFSVLKKQSLLGDCVSHSALPGVVLAFLLTGNKNLEFLLLGGILSGIIATFCIILIVCNSNIKYDSALAIILAVFFGFGLILLTIVQKIPNARQSGLEGFIYGSASAMLERDLNIIFICGAVLLTIVFLMWKEFKGISFDPLYMQTIGFNSRKIDVLLTFLVVIAVVIGLQTVGVILMSALLICPAVSARQWTDKLSKMVILSAFFGALSGFLGVLCSSLIKSMPTGPCIVVFSTFIAFYSILFAKNRGILYKLHQNKKMKKRGVFYDN